MTEIKISNYQEKASRTLPDLGSTASNGAHMALGITTELGEMLEGGKANDIVNVIEEHGDCNWYIANECNIYGLSFLYLYSQAKVTRIPQFKLENIVDLHKREFAYGKPIEKHDLELELINLIAMLIEVAENFDFSYEESLQKNIAKLYKRFPDKFNQEDALNRDLETERKVLES